MPLEQQKRGQGIIFYPGALVDAKAYAPKLASVVHATRTPVFIVKPHFRLADLDVAIAGNVLRSHPEITRWYFGGHSMGGGAACQYSQAHPDVVKGLFLFAAYCAPDAAAFAGQTLALAGSNDSLEPLSKIQNHLPRHTTIISIDGANHASFGDYGSQPFDGQQTISQAAMTDTITRSIVSFIK